MAVSYRKVVRKYKKKSSSTKKKSFAQKVKQVMIRRSNTKRSWSTDTSNFQSSLKHQNGYLWNIPQQIAQGSADSSRTGDEIYIQKFMSRMTLIPNTASTIIVRELLFQWDTNLSANVLSNFNTTYNGSIFLQTLPSFVTAATPDEKTITILSDRRYVFSPSSSGMTANNWMVECVLKKNIHKDYTYDTNTPYSKNKNLYLGYWFEVPGGSTGITSVGACYINGCIYFKDNQ